MKKQLLVLIFLFPFYASSQDAEENLSKKAFDHYLEDRYDSALFYYKQILKIKNSRSGYYLNQIGKCYFGIKENNTAKSYFLECLQIPDTIKKYFYRPIQGQACLELSQIFIAEGNYEAALKYLETAEEKYPYRRVCGNGEFERKMRLAKQYAVCFDNLNKTDSAITRLTRFMFTKSEDFYLDSTEYITEYINYYYDLLCKKYSPCDLKLALADAVNNIYYKKEKTSSDSTHDYYAVECYLMFLGKKVLLEEVEYEARSWGGEPVEPFTLNYLLKYVTETPLYKKINGL